MVYRRLWMSLAWCYASFKQILCKSTLPHDRFGAGKREQQIQLLSFDIECIICVQFVDVCRWNVQLDLFTARNDHRQKRNVRKTSLISTTHDPQRQPKNFSTKMVSSISFFDNLFRICFAALRYVCCVHFEAVFTWTGIELFFLLSFRTYWAKPILEFYHISFDSIFMISSVKSESREREKHITHFYVSNFQIVNIYFSGWRTKILHFDMSIIIDL